MTYLQYIDDAKIEKFVKTYCCPNADIIIVSDGPQRNYINVYTNLVNTTLHITDFDCINLDGNKNYTQQWRKFAITSLDSLKHIRGGALGDEYISSLRDHLQEEQLSGPIL